LVIRPRKIDSTSGANAQRRFKSPFAPIRLLRILILQPVRDYFFDSIDPERTSGNEMDTNGCGAFGVKGCGNITGYPAFCIGHCGWIGITVMNVMMPKWLQWRRGENSNSHSESLRKVRQRTDQLLRRQEAKEKQEEKRVPAI